MLRPADKNWVGENLENPRVKFVDVRRLGECTGTNKRVARSGHMPATSNIDEDVRFYDGSWAEWRDSEETPVG